MRTLKRKILSDKRFKLNINGAAIVDARVILWCIPETETSRTYKTRHIGLCYYINRQRGIDARMPRKLVSINKNNP